LSKAIPFLNNASGKRAKQSEAVFTVAQLDEILKNDQLKDSIIRASEVSDELAENESALQETERRIGFLFKWQDLPVGFHRINANGLFRFKAGMVSPGEGFAPLDEMEREQPLFHVIRLSEARALVLWHIEAENEVMNSLAEAGFTAEDFSEFKEDPSRELEKFRKEQSRLLERKKALKKEAEKLTGYLPRFEALSDATGIAGFRQNAADSGRRSSTSVLLHAWIRESDIPELKTALEKLGEVELSRIEASEGEDPPVHLSVSATADPYLMLTDMYGRPRGADPDPTPHMAPFYAMFFGICIGDAGYGLALAAGSAVGWYLTEKRQGNSRLFRLLFQGGLASVFWGILLGGWFGMSLNRLPSFLQAAAAPLNSLVPPGESFSLSNQFLYLTLVFGVIQLAWGVVINLRKRIRAGEGISAFIDQAGWMLSLLGLFPWLFDHYLFNIYDNTGVTDSVLLGMLGTGALLIFIMGGREAGNIGGKVGLGAYACYGIVNLLGDVLSYSRLFALALSSAIIASVINQIAGMLSGAIPVVGILLAVIVLAAGHLFNLAMAVLSGFIHTARLQFVEFFGKFYDGTGVPFTPLRYEPKYVRIER
jgi:V/A-type H+-transporting ATPase subunit I